MISKYKVESTSFSSNFDFETKLIELKYKEITDQIYHAKNKVSKASHPFNQVILNAMTERYKNIFAMGAYSNQYKMSVKKMMFAVRSCTKSLIRIEDIKELKGVGKKFAEEITGIIKENFNINPSVIMMTKGKFEKYEGIKTIKNLKVKKGTVKVYHGKSEGTPLINKSNNNPDSSSNDGKDVHVDLEGEEVEEPISKKEEARIITQKKLLRKLHLSFQHIESKEYIKHPKIRCKLFLVVDNCEHLTKTFDFN